MFQDDGMVRESISAMWSELFESLGDPSNFAVEMLDGIREDLGNHTTEEPTVQLGWNLDSSRRRRCNPPIRICELQINAVDGEKGLSGELSESKGCRSPETPRGLVLNGSHRSLIILWVHGVERR